MRITSKIILCFLFFFITNYPQNKFKEKDVEKLFDIINMQNMQKDHKGLVRTLIKILDIDSANNIAKNQLISALKSYFVEIAEKEEFLDSVLHYVGDDVRIPAAQIIVHYYNANKIDRAKQFIIRFYTGNNTLLNIPLEDFFGVDFTNNPIAFRDILALIKPFVLKQEQQEYLFLNLLVEPDNSYKNILNELDLNTSNLSFCQNANEFPRIMRLYFKKNPKPSSELISIVKDNLSECLNENNLAYRAIYFYKKGLWNALNDLYNQSFVKSTEFIVGYRELLDIDIDANPTEADKLLKFLVKYLSTEINDELFNDKELFDLVTKFEFIKRDDIAQSLMKKINFENLNLVTIYNEKSFGLLDVIISKLSDHTLDLRIKGNEFKNFDISIDSARAIKLFTALLENIEKREFISYDNEYLYNFAKICHQLKINNKNIFIELVKRISPNDSSNNLTILSINSILTEDNDNAEKIINNIESIGSESNLDYLQSELEWWQANLTKSKFIDSYLEYKNNKERNSTGKFDYQDNINSVTEENYFAFLIGVESYQDKTMNLQYPLKDLSRLKEILITDYLFAETNVFTIANPDRKNFFEAFEKIKRQIDQHDNLLIFYAGHGYWDENMEQGFWIPSDASRSDRANWISNPEIVAFLKSIKAKHTLLIADACFSGSIFVTRKVSNNNFNKSFDAAYSKVSKKGMTSGANSPVPDKSVFMDYFLKRLKENDSKYLLAETLYLDFRDAVTNNSLVDQRPLYESLPGDEGGEFIFIKK